VVPGVVVIFVSNRGRRNKGVGMKTKLLNFWIPDLDFSASCKIFRAIGWFLSVWKTEALGMIDVHTLPKSKKNYQSFNDQNTH
jgi:hypothetical protein